jgi:hypothetical protein
MHPAMTLDDFFEGFDKSLKIFESLQMAIDHVGHATIRVSQSQIAFVRKKTFARVWIPERYLRRKAAPWCLR